MDGLGRVDSTRLSTSEIGKNKTKNKTKKHNKIGKKVINDSTSLSLYIYQWETHQLYICINSKQQE